MNEVAPQGVVVDVCVRCYLVWFDAGELETLPENRTQPALTPDQKLAAMPLEARLAVAEARLQAHSKREANDIGVSVPGNSLKTVFMVLGLPVEHDPYEGAVPFVTWLTIILMAIGTAAGYRYPDLAEAWSLADAEPFRHGGLTFLTSFFLHGGILHFLGNAYFLFVFGDDVEDHLGPLRFMLLLATATLSGDLLHMLMTQTPSLSVGASGGISGVLAYYVFAKPHARLGTMVFFRPLHFPAWFAAFFWTFSQVLIAAEEVSGIGRVSGLAHLGGAVAGVCLWLVWRPRPNTKAVVYGKK